MRVIGIAGRSGSGKSTVAGLLAAVLSDQGYTVKLDSITHPMKMRALALSSGHVLDKGKWRGWLQDIGSKMRNADHAWWIKQLASRNNMDARIREPFSDKWEPADFLIVTDVRYPNEAEFCAEHGVVWMIEGNHRPLVGAAAAHESETALSALTDHIDFILINNMKMDRLADYMLDLVRRGEHLKSEHSESV